MLKCNLKQWGAAALLAGALTMPPATSPFIAQAGASPTQQKPAQANPEKLTPSTGTPSRVTPDEADKAAIVAAYRQADGAYDDFDLEGVWENRSESFYLIEEEGKRFSADALKEDLARVFKTIEAMKSTTSIQKIVVQGNKATVEARNSSTMSVPAEEKSSVTANFAFRSTDTWVKQNGRWIFAHTKVHSTYLMSKDRFSGGNSPVATVKSPAAAIARSQAARKDIQAAYNRMVAAAGRKDIQGALGNRTADYSVILSNGSRMSGDLLERSLTYTYKSATSIKSRSVIEKFALQGDIATVTVRASSTTLFPATRYRKRTVLKSAGRSLDTWVKRDGQWFIAQSKTLSIRGTANGEAVPIL